MQRRLQGGYDEARLRRIFSRYGESLWRPRLCGQTAYFELAQRSDPRVLQIWRQGMRDPRLGLRRQGVSGKGLHLPGHEIIDPDAVALFDDLGDPPPVAMLMVALVAKNT